MKQQQVKAYAGIDVAFAKRKRLPIVVCSHFDGSVTPFPLRSHCLLPPAGKGNEEFAEQVAQYLKTIEVTFGVEIQRIGIDAPSAPKTAGSKRRQCEIGLDRRHISCITTPSDSEFDDLRRRAAEHLANGGSESELTGANQLWMMIGFALFSKLSEFWECIEVFPQAIAATLNANDIHKSKTDGLRAQLRAIAHHTRWPDSGGVQDLARVGFGSLHDKLDAYMAAWIASLDDQQREPIGVSPSDVIWVPRMNSSARTATISS
jgi:hypothetical protein